MKNSLAALNALHSFFRFRKVGTLFFCAFSKAGVILILAGVFSAGLSAEGFKSKYFYSFELGAAVGLHFFSENEEWISAREKSLNEDLFFRNRTDFYSRNYELAPDSARSMNMTFSIEGTLGIRLYNFPVLKKYAFFKKLNGIRLRGGFEMYPFAGRDVVDTATELIYTTPNAFSSALVNKSYNAQIKIEESMFLLIPNGGMYYYHESGLPFLQKMSFFRKREFIPFIGFDIGLMFANGMRKYTIEGGPTSIAVDLGSGPVTSAYSIKGELQEHYVNDLGFRFSPVVGGTLQVSGPHFIFFRTGLHLQFFSAELVRRGGFTESATSNGQFSFTYSDTIFEETRSVSFNQTGFFFQLGYSVALL
ncbi:MAG: hypothetical protein KDK41_15940 [Leptospiraceae bacterium]|nr:hypothetical protein [Leptospiraceae bacterium]